MSKAADKLQAGKGSLRRDIVKGVYWEDGTMTVSRMDEDLKRLVEEDVPQWHYHLLDDEGYAMSHGDFYQSEEHVRSALAGVLDDFGVPFEKGKPGKVHEIDALQGKNSRSGRPHCPNCGAKLVNAGGGNLAKPGEWRGRCPECAEPLTGMNPREGSETAAMLASPSLMVAMFGAIWAFLASMFASLSNYTEDAVANAYGNNTSFAVAQPYTKLHIGDPGEDGTGNAAGETTRKSTSFGASSGGVITTDADLTWTNVSTSETLSYVSQWDASSGGNCLGSGALTASKAVIAGDTFSIPSGSLTVTLT